MAAYVITDVRVTDEDRYRRYTALSPQAVASAGGEFLVRGGTTRVLEGTWRPERVVVVRFESMAAAVDFYNSARYVEARAQREGATEHFNMIVVEGV